MFAAAPGLDRVALAAALGLDDGSSRRRPGEYVVARRRHAAAHRRSRAASCATGTSRSPRCRPGRRSLEDGLPPDHGRSSAGAAGEHARRSSRAGPRRADAAAAAGREPDRHARDPARGARVLRQGRHRRHRLRRPVDFLVPGVLALSVMATAMVSLGIATGFERRYGVLKRLGFDAALARRPARGEDRRPCSCSKSCSSCSSFVTGSRSVGTCPRRLVPALGLLLLGTVAFAGIGLLMAGTLRAEANLAAANALFLVLLFLGGMAYPLDQPARARSRRSRGCSRRRRCPRRCARCSPTRRSRPASSPCSSPGRSPPRCRGPLLPLGRMTEPRMRRHQTWVSTSLQLRRGVGSGGRRGRRGT